VVEDYVKASGDAELSFYYVVPNDPHLIKTIVDEATRSCNLVIVTGGTGVSPRDKTVDALADIGLREVESIADLARLKSLEDVGDRAFVSRGTALVVGKSLVIAIPGNPRALRTLLETMGETLKHVVEELEGVARH
jgi:molybdenum cofactor biosynthesis protein B